MNPIRQPHPSADVRPTPLARLAGVELRKALDTRAGPCVLLLMAGLSVAGLGYGLVEGSSSTETLRDGLFGPQLLLPVVGVLAMTGEWAQRTALTTFTLTPRRGRVLAAKILALLALSTAVFVTVAALAAAVAPAGGPGQWLDAGPAALGLFATTTAVLVQGIAFGALLQHTAAALVLYFLVPPVWNTASNALLDDGIARWFDVFAALDALGRLDAALTPPVLVAFAVWIGIPLVTGLVRAARRDVS